MSKSRRPYPLVEPSLAEDVLQASILLDSSSNGRNNDFVVDSGLKNLVNINNKQMATANSAPGLSAAPNQTAINQQTAMNSWDGQVATNAHQATLITGAVAGPEILAATGASKMAIGGIMGFTYDAAGQLYQRKPGEEYRLGQSVVAGVTGAVAVPLSGKSIKGDAILGAIVGTTNTGVTNEVYGRNDSIPWSLGLGAAFGGLGNYFGATVNDFAHQSFPSYTGDLVGQGVSSRIGAIPSFLPSPEAKKGGSK